MQTAIARLPNNQKSWTWPFLAMAYWGENSKSKIFYKYKFLSKSAV
jgi:hypothetical protein